MSDKQPNAVQIAFSVAFLRSAKHALLATPPDFMALRQMGLPYVCWETIKTLSDEGIEQFVRANPDLFEFNLNVEEIDKMLCLIDSGISPEECNEEMEEFHRLRLAHLPKASVTRLKEVDETTSEK